MKALAAVLDLIAGLVVLAVGYLGVTVVLQSVIWCYLFFPLLILAATAAGLWRGRASKLSAWLVVALLNLPLLLLVLWVTSPRSRALLALPLCVLAFSVPAVAAARNRPASRVRSSLLLTGLLAFTICLALLTPRLSRALVSSREVNEPAPSFRLNVLGGAALSSAQLRGRVVVLDFWATWCVPCRRELPAVDRAYRQLAGRRDVLFFAVDSAQTDTPGVRGDTPELAREFFRQRGLRVPLAYDADGSLAETLSVHGFPSLVVLDRAGRIRLRHVGYVGAEDLAGKLVALVEQLATEQPGR